ncbi:MAG: SMC-Scp complex subunit ScpB [Gammaproteobacteria bacterium]
MSFSIENIIECLILLSEETLSSNQIIKILDKAKYNKKKIEDAIDQLNRQYESKAIFINKVASGYRFQAKSGLEIYISKLKDKSSNKFSKAFLETIAIIAYKQPVTRGDIENIRGIAVNSNIIRTLLELEWVKVVGHRDSPGKPELFATTTKFLDYFNKNKLSELPEISEVESL